MRLRTPADFGAVIRDRRLALGWNQQELARQVGAGRQWIVGLEKGKAGARLSLVLRTLDVLGIVLASDDGTRREKKKKKKKKTTKMRPPVDIDQVLDNLRKKKT